MRALFLSGVAMFPLLAHAQSVPTLTPRVTLAGPNGMNAAFATKADTNGGTITNGNLSAPNITGGTASGTTVNRIISLLSYGAKCDGVTDDTAAINAWLTNATDAGNAAPANVDLTAPAGTCVFTSTLHNPAGQQAGNVTLAGAGVGATIFLYKGTSTTVDLVDIGDGANPQFNWSIRSFKIQSTVKMTGGTALHLRGLVRSSIGDVVLDGQDGNGNLWNGLWLDQVDSIVSWGNNFATGQNDAIRVNGGSLGSADFGMMGWKVAPVNGGTPPAVGVHVGGGFGGFNCDGGTDVIGNAVNVRVDNALYAVTNRELMFGPMCAIDSAATGAGVEINDTLSGAGDLYVNFSGAWIASSKTNNLQIDTGVNGHLVFNGGTIFNAYNNGVLDNNSNMVQTYAGVQFRQNGNQGSQGFGLATHSAIPSISLVGNAFLSNYSGATYGTQQNLQAWGANNGGIAIGSRLSMAPDGSGNSALVPGPNGTATGGSDNAAFSFHTTSNSPDKVYLGNGVSNPLLYAASAGMWTATMTACGGSGMTAYGADRCLIVYDSTGTERFIPAW